MRPVGAVFQAKASFEKLKEELVPSFDSVLVDWVKGVRRTAYADPSYVLEITYVTPPLRAFVESIVDRLSIFGVIGGPLERGFGFGKTHLLIFLWHLFTSDAYRRAGVGIDENVVRETLALGMDFSRERPFHRLVEELKAYADMRHPVGRVKDPRLVSAVAEVVRRYDHELYSPSSRLLAEVISEILKRYEEMGGVPRLLLLIDELGWGLAQRLRTYAGKMKEGARAEAEAVYAEANMVADFLSYLYGQLHARRLAAVVVWVLAEQDRREISALAAKYQDDELLHNKIRGMLDDIDSIAERYSRGLGGAGLAEFSYSPEHALEIARYRVLKTVGDIDLSELQDRYIKWLESMAAQLNLGETLARYREELRKYYPFSLGLVHLLKKLMNPRDAPRTEYVRTVLSVVSEAARRALSEDPEGSYTIGVRHLSVAGVAQPRFIGDFETDWVQVVHDIEDALSKMEPDKREAAELAAKYILAKGVTANILAILESREKSDIEKYGSTLDELQLEAIGTLSSDKAIRLINDLNEALERLRAESARIDEREVSGKRYYLPSFLKTIYSKLALYIVEERKNLENKAFIPVYIRQSRVPALFTGLRVAVNGRTDDVVLMLTEYSKVRDVDVLLSDETFQRGRTRVSCCW